MPCHHATVSLHVVTRFDHVHAICSDGCLPGPPTVPLCCDHGHVDGQLHALLQERHLVDVVQAFPALRLPLPRLLVNLRQLQPRLYSISSSQLESPARVQLSVSCCR